MLDGTDTRAGSSERVTVQAGGLPAYEAMDLGLAPKALGGDAGAYQTLGFHRGPPPATYINTRAPHDKPHAMYSGGDLEQYEVCTPESPQPLPPTRPDGARHAPNNYSGLVPSKRALYGGASKKDAALEAYTLVTDAGLPEARGEPRPTISRARSNSLQGFDHSEDGTAQATEA